MFNVALFVSRRLALLALVLAAALPAACAAGAGEQRPVIAVGDLHGDYDAYVSILGNAGLIDAAGKWIGGKAVLVQLGDVPDRGPDTKKIVEHLMTLEKQARRKGGRVVALVGNHEAMNVVGDLRYVTAAEYAAFADAGSPKRRDAHFKANFAELAAFYRKKDPSLDDAISSIAWPGIRRGGSARGLPGTMRFLRSEIRCSCTEGLARPMRSARSPTSMTPFGRR